MSKAYTVNGKRISSMTHAKKGHTCDLCGFVAFGNGGKVSHGRRHVRHGQAVELVKDYGAPGGTMRVFLAPNDPKVTAYLDRGFTYEEALVKKGVGA